MSAIPQSGSLLGERLADLSPGTSLYHDYSPATGTVWHLCGPGGVRITLNDSTALQLARTILDTPPGYADCEEAVQRAADRAGAALDRARSC